MEIGIPSEVMDKEFRVSMTPAAIHTLVKAGHKVFVQKGAGLGSSIQDSDFEQAGAQIAATAQDVFAAAEMIVKVKEPLEQEYHLFQDDQILYTFLHLAPKKQLTRFLCEKRVKGIGYETIQLDDGSLPLLAPMSEVAGRMSVQVGAHYLEKGNGGSGVLLGGVPGVEHGKVTIIGGGTAGANALRIAQAMGADVTVIDVNMKRLEYLDELFSGRIKTLVSSEYAITDELKETDLVIGAVLIPGRSSPKLVTREMVASMRAGSVIVDVAIDQGGCVETARITSHSQPVYMEEEVVHYCVPNMPGAVPRTSTFALTNVTLPYALEIADKGFEKAVMENNALKKGLNVYGGKIACREVAESQGVEWEDAL